jgi:predicted esterase
MTAIRSLAFSDTTTGRVLLGASRCIDGISRPYAVYVPSGYDSKTPMPLLVHLHGIVGRPAIEPNLNTYVGDSAMMAAAEKQGYFVLFPFGQKGATWFDQVGIKNVFTQIRTLKTEFNIDDDRVYLGGISDGASAAFLLAMILPNDFAAFAALNGSMGVGSEDGGFSTYAPNMSNSYIYVTTADRDRYYPTSQMERTISMAENAGAHISYRKLTGEHIASLADFDYVSMLEYLDQHPRSPFPAAIIWETTSPDYGFCRWLAIDEITVDEAATWYVDYNVALVDSTLSIGIIPYEAFSGGGVKVASVSGGDCVAARIGVKAEDIIIGGNGLRIDSLADLGRLRGTFKHGEEVTLTVKRGESELILNGRVPEPRNYLVFKREKPSAVIKARYEDNHFDLLSSRVGAFRILISPEMVDVNRPVRVVLDGRLIFNRKVVPDIEYMLRTFLSTHDRKSLFVNELSLRSE